MLLLELLSRVNIDGRKLTENPEVTGINDYSSKVQPGQVFVAVKGYKLDGHDFIDEAINNGACAVVAEQAVSALVPVIVVNNTRIALAELSNAWYNYPAQAMTMIGVTASNGKTTTAFMIDHILSGYFPTTGLIGTVIIKDGKSTTSADLTTPNSRELFQWLDKMRNNHCSHVTMEVSSAGQELNRVHGIQYSIATFNNLSREHIDFHGTFENYWFQKSKLIRNLPDTSIAVLNADEPMILGLKDQTAAKVITYSLNNIADIKIEAVDLRTGAGSFKYVIPSDISLGSRRISACSHHIQLKVLGLHNIYNAAVAITVAKLCSVPDEQILRYISTFSGVERRFQLIYDREYKIIDDHFANAGNIEITLQTLGLMQYNKLHLLVAIRGNRGSIVNGENAETLVRWASRLPLAQLLTTDSTEFVDAHDEVSPEERTTFHRILNQAGVHYVHYPRLTDAVTALLKEVKTGDVVLLAGCQGMDYGAHTIIPLIAKNYPEQEKQEILQILNGRVAGVS